MRSALSDRKRCSELMRSRPTKSKSSASANATDPWRERMRRRRDQHEAVDAERQNFQAGDVFGAGDDADVGLAVGDRGDDLVAQALFEIDVHLRMRREEVAQWLGQKFRQRIRVGEQAHVTLEAVGVFAQLAAHPLGLLQQQSRVVHERSARRRRLYALTFPIEQRRTELDLHVADARTCGGDGEVHAVRAGSDAAGFHDVHEQLEVDQVEAHGRGGWRLAVSQIAQTSLRFYLQPTAYSLPQGLRLNGTNLTSVTLRVLSSPAAFFSMTCNSCVE